MSAATRLARSIRPLEWVALGFLLWVGLRAGFAPVKDLSWLFTGRSLKIFEGLALVGTFALFAEAWRTPWPAARARAMRIWRSCSVIAAAPLAFSLAVLAVGIADNHAVKTVSSRLGVAVDQGLDALAIGSPTLAIWLAVGLALRQPDGLRLAPFVRFAAKGLGRMLRELLPLAVIISGYGWMPFMIAADPPRDPWMIRADQLLFLGHDPLELLEAWITRPLSEWAAFSYSFYAFLFPLGLGATWLKGPGALRPLTFALAVALVGAYALYSLVPVAGPMFTRGFAEDLQLYWLSNVKEALMDRTRITWDCFPSMHTCASLLIAQALYRSARGVFWAVLPMVVTIPFACVYLRYHYVVDVIAGVAWFGVVAVIARRVEPPAPSGTSSKG